LAAHVARLDQELACDAAVIRRRPESRALYARTLLKTQLAGMALPLGCYWPARSRHPLEVRIGLLRRPSGDGGLEGPLLIGAAVVAAAILAWAAEPPMPVTPRQPAIVADPYVPYGSGQMSVMLVTWRAAPARR
jgi:beta-lactamase regulating signal transducer with metallopeptidase domain